MAHSFFIRKMHDSLDAHEIHERLWQGAKPSWSDGLKQQGFDALVLCATEFQDAHQFPDLEVVLAPNRDNNFVPPTPLELQHARNAAIRVVDLIRSGKRVLVTCWAGLNRSGLVSALAVKQLLGVSGKEAVKIVQYARPGALSNPHFTDWLEQLG